MVEQEHVHGSMDSTAQEKTYQGFLKISARTIITVLVVLAFLALING